jgi:hypothetical protein
LKTNSVKKAVGTVTVVDPKTGKKKDSSEKELDG